MGAPHLLVSRILNVYILMQVVFLFLFYFTACCVYLYMDRLDSDIQQKLNTR